MRWIPGLRTLTFGVWALLGMSAAYWGLRAGDAPPNWPQTPAPTRPSVVDASALVAVLSGQGASEPAVPAPARRLALTGVIAEGRRGVALLSVDGQPPRPFLVGARIDEGLRLHAVGPRRADLADAQSGIVIHRLEMPALPEQPLPAGLTLEPERRP